MSQLPLAGLRVISFEHFGAAPYATLLLATMGAEVIRVEPPGGEAGRGTGAPETLDGGNSLYFQAYNLSKKSIVLDMKAPEDRAVFHGLVETAHVVVNNLRGSVAAELGLDYKSLKHLNPAIVCGHISAYGRENSRRDRPGFDFLMQAEAGLMSMTGEPGTPPARVGVSMIDNMTGALLAFGLTSALHGAQRSGTGCDVDAALFDTALHNLTYQGAWYLNEGILTGQLPRSAHPANTPCQTFRTADGWIYVACMADHFWRRLCVTLERPDLADDQRFNTPAQRLDNRDALTIALDAHFITHSSAVWVEKLGAEVPAAPVYGIGEALDNPFVAEAGMIAELDHPTRERFRVLAPPLRIDGQRPPLYVAPTLGEHAEALRREVSGSATSD